jgi:crossover junction endodeoxyribonuclease RuvC
MVCTILKLNATPQADAADALAIAITHADILQSLVAMNYNELGIHGMSHSHYR